MFTCSPYLNSVQSGLTALCFAAYYGNPKAAELLIAAKADVNIQAFVSHIDGVCVLDDSVVACVY